MRIRQQKIDNEAVSNTTYRQRQYAADIVARAKRITDDTERAARLQVMECVMCHKAGRIGGASMTSAGCGACGAVMRFCSTSTDCLCLECAKEHNLCKHCGSDIDLKQRRKNREFKPFTPPDQYEYDVK